MGESGPLPASFACNFTKSGVHMRHVSPKKPAKFYGLWAINGGLTLIKVENAPCNPMQNDL